MTLRVANQEPNWRGSRTSRSRTSPSWPVLDDLPDDIRLMERHRSSSAAPFVLTRPARMWTESVGCFGYRAIVVTMTMVMSGR